MDFRRTTLPHRHNPAPDGRKISVSIRPRRRRKVSMQLDNFSADVPFREQESTRPGTRRLIVAVLLGVAAVAGLTLVERSRVRVPPPAPPHEPSQALITTVAPPPEPTLTAAPIAPPVPTAINNDEEPGLPTGSMAQDRVESNPSGKPVTAADATYMVQLGAFLTATNAQILQKQLKRAGINAHLETFVKVGPFKDRRDAEKALARAKKLGIKAVLVGQSAIQ